MAKKPEAASPPAYDPDTSYEVRVARPVSVGPIKYLPRDVIEMRGARLNRIVEEHGHDAIAAAVIR